MIKCKNCQSVNVKVSDLNFAKIKPEGWPAAKYTYDKYSFLCLDCNQVWESEPESQKDYYDYMCFRDRTTLVAHKMEKNKKIIAQHINLDDMEQRARLSKKIVNSYKHLLDLPPEEWYAIERDAISVD